MPITQARCQPFRRKCHRPTHKEVVLVVNKQANGYAVGIGGRLRRRFRLAFADMWFLSRHQTDDIRTVP